ncbi:MAG: hypothetical protein HYZ53_19860 [Planctomycetes bacterium]|nr:hypothetical protein [Planctomycetota bacterium]
MKKALITWDGKHLPAQLKRVPPGQYSLEAVSRDPALDVEEERGLEQALRQLDAGEGRSLASVLSEIRGRRKRS